MFEDTSSVDDYEIRWYRYKLGAPSADEYSGVYWEKLNEEDDTKSFFQKIIPDKTLAEEKVKVIIFYNNNRYYANEIIFTNEEEVPNYATVDSQNALTIQCDDGTYGNYRIYNEGNSLID
jgi:hypothetical protein